MIKDYYAVLGLDRDTTDEEIKAVYRTAVKECHPDVAGDNPELVARFQELTTAYKILTDPHKRRLHDQELPIKSYPLRRPTPERVWKEVNEVILLRSDRVGQFQRSIQDAIPLAIEGDLVVVGYPGERYRNGSYLEVAANRTALMSALQLIMGRPMEFRYIQGESLDDWERTKANDARAAAKARTATATTVDRASASVWDALNTRLHHSFNELPQRRFPQVRATFMFEALGWIEEAETAARAQKPTDEVLGRALATAIERVGTLTDIPANVVAIEYIRLRKQANAG
jgi:curved DNA-binding protein CbpA